MSYFSSSSLILSFLFKLQTVSRSVPVFNMSCMVTTCNFILKNVNRFINDMVFSIHLRIRCKKDIFHVL